MPDSVCQTPSARQSGRGPSGRRRVADGIWQTPSARHCVCLMPSARRPSARCRLPDGSLPDCLADAAFARHGLPDTVCQTPSGRQSGRGLSGRHCVCQTPPARCCLPDGPVPDCLAEGGRWPSARLSGRHRVCQMRHLADAVCLIPSCRRCLPDAAMPDATSARHCLPDATSTRQSGRGVCQTVRQRTVWQTASGRQCLADDVCQMPSARRLYARLSGRHRIWQTQCLADGVWQTPCA